MNKELPKTGPSFYKENPCPQCGRLFSTDWRICFKITRVCMCYFCKHVAEDHLSTVHQQITNYPRDLSRLGEAGDGPYWLLVLFFLASCLGHKRVHEFVVRQTQLFKNNLPILRKMNSIVEREPDP
jgi:hypothetical protein